MTEGRIIYNPSASVMKMFYRKMNAESREELKSRKFDAVGLLQTMVAVVSPKKANVVICCGQLPLISTGYTLLVLNARSA